MAPYKGYTEARNKASQRYNKAHLEQIAIRVPIGTRAKYKALADRLGESLAGLICRLLEEEAARHPAAAGPPETETAAGQSDADYPIE